MSLRTASRQNGVLFAGLVFALGWVSLTLLGVLAETGEISLGNWIGQHGIGGVIGAIALVAIVGLVLSVVGELSETDPAPTEWPPSE